MVSFDIFIISCFNLAFLRGSLVESQATNEHLRKQLNRLKSISRDTRLDSLNISSNGFLPPVDHSAPPLDAPYSPTMSVIEEAKADIEKMKKTVASGMRRRSFFLFTLLSSDFVYHVPKRFLTFF